MEIAPTQITNFNRTDAELQSFWLFCAFCAGKNSDVASRALSRLLSNCKDSTPFQYLSLLGETGVHNVLVAAKVGQYSRLTRFIMESIQLDLREATLKDLMGVFGVGPKTARFFLLHSRPNGKCAVLDTHILKYMRDKGFLNVPDSTPTNLKQYSIIEEAFLNFISYDFPMMSVADVDLYLWMKYSGRLENDQIEPEVPFAPAFS